MLNVAEIAITATDKTQEGISSASKSLEQLEKAATGVSSTISSLSTVFGTLGASIAATGILEYTKHAIDAGDELYILSQKTGIAVENLAGLEFAAKMNGSSLESTAQGVKKLSTFMFDAATGSKANADMLQILGVTAKEPLPAMQQIAETFSKMNDGAEKSAVAVKLFGKSGLDMIPMLNQGSKALVEMIDEGKKLNPVTADFTARSNDFNDNLDRMAVKSKGNAMLLANELLPAITNISQAMLNASGDGTAFALAGDVISFVLKTIAVAGGTVVYSFKEIGDGLYGLGQMAVAAAQGNLSEAKAIHAEMIAQAEKDKESWAKYTADIIDGQTKIEAEKSKPKTDDSKAKELAALAAKEAAAAAAQAAIDKMMQQSDQLQQKLAVSQMDSFTKTVDEYIKMQDKLTSAGVAGIAARSKNEQAFWAFVDAHNVELAAKQKVKEEADTKHRADTLLKETDYFAKMQNLADVADAKQSQKKAAVESQRFQADIIDFQRRFQLAQEDHTLTLAELEAFEQAKENIIKRHQDNQYQSDTQMVQFGKDMRKADYAHAMDTAAAMTAGVASHNKTMFEINKTAGIASALIHTYEAIAGVLKEFPGPVGWAMSAAQAALGMAQVSAISNTSFGSGGSASAAGAAAVPSRATSPSLPVTQTPAAAATAPAAAPSQPVNVYIQGNVMTADFVNNTVIPQIKDQIANADVTIIDPRSRQAQMLAGA